MSILRATNGKFVIKDLGLGKVGLKAGGVDLTDPLAQVIIEAHPDGDKALSIGGLYWSAQKDGTLQCNRTAKGPWERFKVVTNGTKVGFVSVAFNTIVSARIDEPNSPLRMVSMRPVDADEAFEVTGLVASHAGLPQPLHVDGRVFRYPDGTQHLYTGVSNFSLLRKWIEGGKDNVDPLLDQLQEDASAAGLTDELTLRAFRFAAPPNTFALQPKDHGDYIPQLVACTDYVGSRSLRVEWTAGDAQIVMPSQSDQQRHLNDVCAALAGKPHVFIETCNEPFKNGMDVNVVRPPSGLLRASGDYDPTTLHQTMLDYMVYHGTRTGVGDYAPKFCWDPPQEMYNGWGGFGPVTVPIVHDEPIGWAEVATGSRSNNPKHAKWLGQETGAWLAGGTFHRTDEGPMGPQTRACFQAWLRGMIVGLDR